MNWLYVEGGGEGGGRGTLHSNSDEAGVTYLSVDIVYLTGMLVLDRILKHRNIHFITFIYGRNYKCKYHN